MAKHISTRRAFSLSIQLLLLLMCLLSISNAQITIPQTGLSNLMMVGSTINGYHSDSSFGSINIGKRGGPNVYDLTGFNLLLTGIAHVYSTGAIPTLAARYPAKGITFGGSPETIENNPVFFFGTDTVFVVGQASLVPLRHFTHNLPYEVIAVYPLTYRASRVTTHMTYDTTYAASGAILSTNSYSGSDSTDVDAYGTLKVLGKQFECLRVKLNHFTYSDKEFLFMTREGVFLDVAMPSSQPDEGLVQPTGVTLMVPTSITSVNQSDLLPEQYSLDQNYPNPFNPTTRINFQLTKAGWVSLRVYDILGRQMATLIDGLRPAGLHTAQWDGRNENGEPMPSGIYMYQLGAGSFAVTKKMMLLK
jgi:hypothetical protein